MGYNIGGKAVSIALLALTNGDRNKAEAIWDKIRYQDPNDIEQGLDIVEKAIAEVEAEAGNE